MRIPLALISGVKRSTFVSDMYVHMYVYYLKRRLVYQVNYIGELAALGTSQFIAAIEIQILISRQLTHSLCLLEMVLMQGQSCSIKCSILRFARNHASVLFHTVPVTYRNNHNTITLTTTSLPSVKCLIKSHPVPTQLRRPF